MPRPRKRAAAAPPKPTHEPPLLQVPQGPHNGSGRPHLQFPDPFNGDMIGGQIAATRMTMRYPHCVMPWARRQGKTTFRSFVVPMEAALTPGHYYAGICYPDHTTAAKVAEVFRQLWGPMVRDFKINDKDQDRWIDLVPSVIRTQDEPPDWLSPALLKRWNMVHPAKGKTPNDGSRVYFWGCAHPHYEKVQGFPHHFNRVDWDETQQIHPHAYGIIRPMIRDVLGHECFTGTPWVHGIGNVQFEKFWRLAGSKEGKAAGWFRMRIPDGTNPHVPETDLNEARLSMTEQEIDQTLFAKFLTGEGAVFQNLKNVLVLPFLPPACDALAWCRAIRSEFTLPSLEWWVNLPAPTPQHVYAASVDWARSPKGDFTAISVFDLSTGDQAALLRMRGEDLTRQMEAVFAILRHYAASELHADNNGLGLTMTDFMRRRLGIGFRLHKFGTNKGDYVTRGRVLFQDEEVRLINCAVQFNEFKQYSAYEADTLTSEKKITYSAPPGEHDDTVSAFLHLAPTLTISGRQIRAKPPEPEPPMFDDEGRTTLERFMPGAKMPWHDPPSDPRPSWDDVVLPWQRR